VIIRPASSQTPDRESSRVKDQRSTTVLRRQPGVVHHWTEKRNRSLFLQVRCVNMDVGKGVQSENPYTVTAVQETRRHS